MLRSYSYIPHRDLQDIGIWARDSANLFLVSLNLQCKQTPAQRERLQRESAPRQENSKKKSMNRLSINYMLQTRKSTGSMPPLRVALARSLLRSAWSVLSTRLVPPYFSFGTRSGIVRRRMFRTVSHILEIPVGWYCLGDGLLSVYVAVQRRRSALADYCTPPPFCSLVELLYRKISYLD